MSQQNINVFLSCKRLRSEWFTTAVTCIRLITMQQADFNATQNNRMIKGHKWELRSKRNLNGMCFICECVSVMLTMFNNWPGEMSFTEMKLHGQRQEAFYLFHL